MSDFRNYRFDKWDKGEYCASEPEENLKGLEHGAKIGQILSECTICPVNNAGCTNQFKITTLGILPGKDDVEEMEIICCPLSVVDIEHCPLSS